MTDRKATPSKLDAEVQMAANMARLREGLARISQVYRDDVIVVEEDPIAGGAGHFVLYPAQHGHARLVIEEQYPRGTDPDDPNRLVTTWLWCSEHIARDTNGGYAWKATAFGEVESPDVNDLVAALEGWAKRAHRSALDAEAVNAPTRAATLQPLERPRL